MVGRSMHWVGSEAFGVTSPLWCILREKGRGGGKRREKYRRPLCRQYTSTIGTTQISPDWSQSASVSQTEFTRHLTKKKGGGGKEYVIASGGMQLYKANQGGKGDQAPPKSIIAANSALVIRQSKVKARGLHTSVIQKMLEKTINKSSPKPFDASSIDIPMNQEKKKRKKRKKKTLK